MPKAKENKKQLREKLFEKMEKDFGKGSMIGGDRVALSCDVISSGSIRLDKALGIMGLPRGRVVEIYGTESAGKTTLVLEAIAQAHKNPDSYCAFIDAEHALDTSYAKNLGVDLKRLDISQPDFGEQALEIARGMIKSGIYDIVAIDSVAALVPKGEIEGSVGDSKMGLQARMMGQALRIITPDIAISNTCVIFLNQLRDKIGVFWGSPETTTGGNALKFYASVRLDIRRVSTNKEGEEAVSNKVRVKVAKNKLASPFKMAEFNVEFGKGIDRVDELIDLGVELDILEKAGSWYSYGTDKIGQGKKSTIEYLENNPDILKVIETKVLDNINKIQVPELSEEDKAKYLEDEDS